MKKSHHGNAMGFRLQGIADLLFHNPQLANKQNAFAKAIGEISKKSKKSEADEIERHRLEYFGSFYTHATYGIGLPTDNIFAMVCTGAKTIRGFRNKVLGGVLIEGNTKTGDATFLKVIYPGPQTPQEMYEDERYHFFANVIINKQRVFVLRPRIPGAWEIEGIVRYSKDINFGDLQTAFIEGAILGSLGDYRPRYGRSTVEFFGL
jgi:hypothetical protein